MLVLIHTHVAEAQFIDTFDGGTLDGWTARTGDGEAVMDLRPADGHAVVTVDATGDRMNIWWAVIARVVSPALDLSLLQDPDYELRVETRIRVSHAPRRVNLHLNTQKTTDFHTHLMEYDIPDTSGWHTISMTTRGFEAEPGDRVTAQMALMDWGLERYRVDVDYFNVDVVHAATAGRDVGEPLPYHPPVPDAEEFALSTAVTDDAMVDSRHPDVNFNGWYASDRSGRLPVLTVGGTQTVLLRWNLDAFRGIQAVGSGLLELTTHAVQRVDAEQEEFGRIRVVEVIGGDPRWKQEHVTFRSWTGGADLKEVLNGQMIIDIDAADERNGKTYVVITRPVIQRLLDGRTKGLALLPLGAVQASFYASEHAGGDRAPTLLFNLQQ